MNLRLFVKTIDKYFSALFFATAITGFILFATPAFSSGPCDAMNDLADTGRVNAEWLKPLAARHFDAFVIARGSESSPSWWEQTINAIDVRDSGAIAKLYENVPRGEEARAARLLETAIEEKIEIPASWRGFTDQTKARREKLRARDMNLEPGLTAAEEKQLTYLFVLLGIRRSKIERVLDRTKSKFGFASNDLVPVIKAGRSLNVFGDEARLFVEKYNEATKRSENHKRLFNEMMTKLFELYTLRVYQPLEEPWFKINGETLNLEDFINAAGYYQPVQKPTNSWMTVGRLRPETVKNPGARSRGLIREMWWNRKSGIQPIGTVRIARNTLPNADGTENLVSVEVLHQGEDGIFVPYLFEPNSTGRFKMIRGEEGRRMMRECFACHLRLTGIFFGGITLPNYEPSPDWHINWIDRIKQKDRHLFDGLK